MTYNLLRTIAIFNLLWAVAAIPWVVPTPTAGTDQVMNVDGWSPKPTQDPLNYELFKRQIGSRTCGYRNGKRRTPLTCSMSSLCVTNTFFGFIGCCDPEGIESCTPPTACVPSSQLTKCGSKCQAETQTMKCQNKDTPNCMTAYHDYITTQYTEYRCGGNVRFTAFPTFSGQSTATQARTSQGSITAFASGEEDNDNLEGEDGAQVDDAAGEEGSGDDSGSKDDGKAATVGGIVGGLGVFAFLVLGITALFLRHRRLNRLGIESFGAAGQREMKFSGSKSNLHSQIATHWYGRRLHAGHDRSRNGSHECSMKDSREINEAP